MQTQLRKPVSFVVALLGLAAIVTTLTFLPGIVSASGSPQKKTVKLGDNFFSPSKLTVNRSSTITWKWPDNFGQTHDVKLVKGPSGAKKFKSGAAAAAYSFKQKLSKPGKYQIICTFHQQEMTMTITVRK